MSEPRDPFNRPASESEPTPAHEQELNQPPEPVRVDDRPVPLPRSERPKTTEHSPESQPPRSERPAIQNRPMPQTTAEAKPSSYESDYLVDEMPLNEEVSESSRRPNRNSPAQDSDNEENGLPARISRSWNEFWFGPIESSFNFSLFRTGLGITAFVWLATFIPDLMTFFGSNGLDPVPFYQTSRIGIFRWLKADIFLWIGLVTGLVASGLLVWGRYVKIAGPILAILVTSFMGENRLLWNAGDEVLRTFTLFFGFFCLLTPSYVLDTAITKASKLNVSMPEGRNWLFRLIQIQMTIIYVVTFLAKIPGDMWRDGTATMTLFRLESMERFYVPGFLESNFLFGNLFTWGTLILEGLLPILLWNRRLRPYAVVAGVTFHLMIAWSISIGLFSWVMVLGYIPFLSPNFRANIDAVLGRVRQARS